MDSESWLIRAVEMTALRTGGPNPQLTLKNNVQNRTNVQKRH